MSTDPVTPDTPALGGTVVATKPVPSTYLYLRIQDRMEQLYADGGSEFRTPVGFITHGRRIDETQPQPKPFYEIAAALTALTGVKVTHESIRRWYRRGVPVTPATP